MSGRGNRPPLMTHRRLLGMAFQEDEDGVYQEGEYNSDAEAAVNCRLLVHDLKYSIDSQGTELRPMGFYEGSEEDVAGSYNIRVTFSVYLRGSSAPGVATPLDTLLQTAGHGRDIKTGSVAFTPVTASTANLGANPAFTLAGYSLDYPSLITIVCTSTDTADGARTSTFLVTVTPYGVGIPDDAEVLTASVTYDHEDPGAMATGIAGLSVTVTANPGTGTFRVGDSFGSAASVDAGLIYYPKHGPEKRWASLAFFEDGRLHRIRDAQGKVKFMFNRGEPVKMDFEYLGCVLDTDPHVDQAMPDNIDYTAIVRPPTFLSAILNIHGNQRVYTKLELDPAMELVMREDASEKTGYKSARIGDRNVSGTVDSEAKLIADFNPFEKVYTGAIGTLLLDFGSTPGNRFQLRASNVQSRSLSDDERNKMTVNAEGLKFNRPRTDLLGKYREYELEFW